MPNCIHCKSGNTHFAFDVEDIKGKTYSYRRCYKCNVVFINPFPTMQQLEKAYSDSYYGSEDNEKFSNSFVVEVISYFSKRRAKRLSKKLSPNAKIMDFGCGNGRFLEHLSDMNMNYQLHGLEIDTKAALRANKRLNGKAWIHTVSELDMHFSSNSFDAITCIHVFEHTLTPANLLNDFSKLIKPGGKLMIVIPNIKSIQYKVFKEKWFHIDPPRHIHFYYPALLTSEMQSRGFRVLYLKTFDIEQNPFGAIQSILNTILSKRDVLFERLKGNTDYAKQYGKTNIFMMKIFWILLLPFFILSDFLVSYIKKGACIELLFEKYHNLQTKEHKNI